MDETGADGGALRAPLAAGLSLVAARLGVRRSAEAFLSGFPLTQDGDLPQERLADAAARAGLTVREVEISRLTALDVPAIAIRDDGAVEVVADILTGRGRKPAGLVLEGGGKADFKAYRKGFSGRLYALAREAEAGAALGEGGEAPPLGRLIRRSMWANRGLYAQILLGTLMVNLLGLAMPLYIMNVYDRVVPTGALESLWVLSAGVILAGLFDVGLRQLRGYLTDIAGRRMDVVLGNQVLDRMLQARVDRPPTASGSTAHAVRELDALREFFNSGTLVALGDLPFLGLFLAVLWIVAGNIALVPLVALPAVLLASLALQPFIIAFMGRAYRNASNRNAVLFDILGGMETLKALGAESWAARRWERAHAASLGAMVPIRGLSLVNTNLIVIAQVSVTVVMVIFGVHAIAEGELSQGGLIAAVLLSGRAMAPLGQVVQAIGRLHGAVVAYRALKPLLEAPLERPAGEAFVQPERVRGAIRFDRVEFSYPLPAGQNAEGYTPSKVLDGLSLSFAAGEKAAVVGAIGSGKTTLVKLVLGLYRATSGRVFVDDLDVTRVEPADLRQAIGYVPQVPQFFQGTIRENVTLHYPQASEEEILAAMAGAGARSWLEQCPLGLDQPVGEHGGALSGGQRQSLALARALIRKPPVLLLDEPTSQLDSRTESAFIEHLKGIVADRTLLVVTHRPALLSLVDRLVVMDRGAIAADGPKQEVLRKLGHAA